MKLAELHAVPSKVPDFTGKMQVQRNPTTGKELPQNIRDLAKFHRAVCELDHFYSALTGIKSLSNGSGRREDILKRDTCASPFQTSGLNGKEL